MREAASVLAQALNVRPNGLRISRRKRAAYENAKIATISRAKRSDCMRVLDGIWLVL